MKKQNQPKRLKSGCLIWALLSNELISHFIDCRLLTNEHFIGKKELIAETWDKARNSKGEIIREVSFVNPSSGKRSSMSNLKYTPKGIFAQAICSSNQDALGIAKILKEQILCMKGKHVQLFYGTNIHIHERNFGAKALQELQNQFGSDTCEARKMDYLLVNPRCFSDHSSNIYIEAFEPNKKEEFERLVKKVRSSVYLETEELNISDIFLEDFDKVFRQFGLRRYRKVFLARLAHSKKYVATLVINQGSFGLNLGAMENRCDLMILPDLLDCEMKEVTASLMNTAIKYYGKFPINLIPVITDKHCTQQLIEIDPKALHTEYTRSSFVKQCPEILDHYCKRFSQFIGKLESRAKRLERKKEDSQRSRTKDLDGEKNRVQKNYFAGENPLESERLDKKWSAERLLHELKKYLQPGMSFIDSGGGPGSLSYKLAEQYKGVEIVSVDASQERTTIAKKKLEIFSNAKAVLEDIHNLSFASNKFDIGSSSLTFQHMLLKLQALQEIVRVVKPGGRIFLDDTDNVYTNHFPYDRRVEKTLQIVHTALAPTGFDVEMGRKLFYLCHEAGLEEVKILSIEPYDLNSQYLSMDLELATPILKEHFQETAEDEKRYVLEYFNREDTISFGLRFLVTAVKPY